MHRDFRIVDAVAPVQTQCMAAGFLAVAPSGTARATSYDYRGVCACVATSSAPTYAHFTILGNTSKLDRDEALATRVVEEYCNGAPLHALACRYGVGWDALRRTLISRGIEIRTKGGVRAQPIKPPTTIRSKKRMLTDEQVERLRKAVGFEPSWVTMVDDD